MKPLTPDYTLLGLLAIQPQHGYQLLRIFQDPQQLGRVWHMSTSQLYNVLKRLDQQGLIAGREVEVQDAPSRTEYHLTAAGEARLHNWLQEKNPSTSIRRVRVDFLSRLYVARALGIPTGEIIRWQRDACVQQRDALARKLERAVPGMDSLTLEFVVIQLDAIVHWIDLHVVIALEEKQ